MAFRRIRGKVKFIHLPVTTSQVFAKDSLVEMTSGLVGVADNGEDAVNVLGIIKHAIAATDADYATARTVEVEVPVERFVEYEADVDGNLATTDIGLEFDVEDASTIDHDATTDKVFLVTKYISATKCHCCIKFKGSY